MDGVGHIGLGPLPGDKILLGPGLACHLVDQGNALGLCGKQIVIAARLQQLQQLPAAGLGKLGIAEADERADIQIVGDLTDGQLPLEPGHGHGISGHNKISILPQGERRRCGCRFSANHPPFPEKRRVSCQVYYKDYIVKVNTKTAAPEFHARKNLSM